MSELTCVLGSNRLFYIADVLNTVMNATAFKNKARSVCLLYEITNRGCETGKDLNHYLPTAMAISCQWRHMNLIGKISTWCHNLCTMMK